MAKIYGNTVGISTPKEIYIGDGDMPDNAVVQLVLDAADEEEALKTELFDYVNDRVASVIDAAPEALNTLNELAAALGNNENFAADVAEEIGKKVDKVEGKQLSTNDFTDQLLTKLNGIEAGANKYTHATHNPHASGFYKVTVDNEGHISAVTSVTKADITGLGIPGKDTVYTHPDKHSISEVDGLQDALSGLQTKGDYAAEDHTHTASEITDFDTTIKSYDYATKTEAQAMADGKDGVITAAQKTADDITKYVGTFTHDTAKSVVEYIDAKTDGNATSGNLEALGTRVVTAEGEIDALQEALSGKADAHDHPYIPTSQKGAVNGVAELDSSGKVPTSQLPSYVDDVIEGYFYNSKFYKESDHTTAITGETGKIYIDLTTSKTYRWSGSAYAIISETLALGETSSTAYRGDRGKTAYDHSQTAHAPSNAEKNQNAFSNVIVGSKTITADSTTDNLTLIAGSNITLIPDETSDSITIAAADTTYGAATSSTAGLVKIGYTANDKNYPVALNEDGKMFVNVPWTDVQVNTQLINLPKTDWTNNAKFISCSGLVETDTPILDVVTLSTTTDRDANGFILATWAHIVSAEVTVTRDETTNEVTETGITFYTDDPASLLTNIDVQVKVVR